MLTYECDESGIEVITVGEIQNHLLDIRTELRAGFLTLGKLK